MRKKSLDIPFDESGQSSHVRKSLNYETTTTSVPSISGSYEIDTFDSEVAPLHSEKRTMPKSFNPPQGSNGEIIRIPYVDEDNPLLSQNELQKSPEGVDFDMRN